MERRERGGKKGGGEAKGEVSGGGWEEENKRITTAHRYLFGWRCFVDCRVLAFLKNRQ